MPGLAPLGDYLRFVVTLTAVVDPFLAIPFFLTFAASYGEDARNRLARTVALTVFGVLAVAAFVGEALLDLIGASLPAFRVGGGLVLLLMALAMLNAQAGGVRPSTAEGGGAVHQVVIVLCIAVVCVVVWIALRAAHRVAARMGTTGMNVATRILGLLLPPPGGATKGGGVEGAVSGARVAPQRPSIQSAASFHSVSLNRSRNKPKCPIGPPRTCAGSTRSSLRTAFG